MSIRQRNAHFTDWAAVCKALHVNTESEARAALESSDNTFYYYVCYIKSTKEIYTHGQIYSCSGNDDLLDLINELTTEVVENEEVTAKALSDLNENKASRGEVEMFELSKQDKIDDLDSIRTKANNAVQPDQISNFVLATDLAKVATTGNYNDLLNKPAEVTSQTVADWGFITSADFSNELLNSSRLSFYCVEPVNVILNGETLSYEANSNIDITITPDDVYEIVPTSDSSITSLTSFPGPLSTFYSWLEGVNIFSNIVFDMNDLAMYEKWNQGHQGQYHVQMAQYTNCIFWSDNPYISDINSRTNYTLYNSSQLPLCYSSIPENTFKSFYCAYGVTNDPNWSSAAYKQSFANATWATQVFSYYGLQTIGVYDQDSPKFNITLPKDCRGLMFAASSIENAGVFDAINVTNFGAKSGSWRDAFAYCYALTNLYIKNLKVSINISWSPISQAALEYIIDNAANTNAITISLSPHTYHQLNDTVKANAVAKNITLELLTVNASQDSRLAWLVNNGDGTKVLSNNGNYISLDNKQNVIDDLDTIRDGASKGATALQEHQPLKTINGESLIGEGDITIEGGGGVTVETDPVFSASPAAGITEEKISEWDNKVDAEDINNLKPWIADFSIGDINAYVHNGTNFNYSRDSIINALQNKQPIYIPHENDGLEGYYTAYGFVEDFIYLYILCGNFLYSIKLNYTDDGIASIDVRNLDDFAKEGDLTDVAFTADYNDLNNKPTIPSEVTESTVSDWGFTKNSGTITSVKINGNTKTPTDGLIDLGTVLTSYSPMTVSITTDGAYTSRLKPNKRYAYTGDASSNMIFTIDLSTLDTLLDNTWHLNFKTGSTIPTINFSISQGYTLMWANGIAPSFEENTFYEISIKLVGTYLLGVCGAFKTV